MKVITPIEVLQDRGFKPDSDLPYCTADGTEFFIGHNKDTAAIVCLMEDEERYLLDKGHLRYMADTAKTYEIKQVLLYTNYGVELHSKHEKPSCVNLDRIYKIDSEGANLAIYKN